MKHIHTLESFLNESLEFFKKKIVQKSKEYQEVELYYDDLIIGRVIGRYEMVPTKTGAKSSDFSNWKYAWNFIGSWNLQELYKKFPEAKKQSTRMWSSNKDKTLNAVINAMTADFKRNLDLDNHISEGNRLLRGASKETLARDTEESDREYIQLSKKRDILAQKKYKKDYKELHPNQKDIINKELRS